MTTAKTPPASQPDSAAKAPLRARIKHLLGRKAPWWVKVARSLVLAAAALVGIDRVLLPALPGRPLTTGETDMLEDVFRDSVAYDKIRIHHSGITSGYMRWRGITATTRGNVIIFEKNKDAADYAATSADDYHRYALLHETAHIWQDRHGLMPGPVTMAFNNFASLLPGADRLHHYHYDLTSPKELTAYNIEQQAGIIADYYFAVRLGMTPAFHADNNDSKDDIRARYETTLKDFIADASYPRKVRP